jgi:hypothetical protein
LQFNERIAWESVEPHGGTDVAACFTEDGDEKIGCAVNDCGRVRESIDSIYIAIDRQYFGNFVEGAKLPLKDSKLGERAGSGRCVAFFYGPVEAGGSGDEAVWSHGNCTGEVDDFADPFGGDIVASRGRWRGQFIAQ